MVKSSIVLACAALLLAGCGGSLHIRPVTNGGSALSRFDQLYASGKASLRQDRVGLALVYFEKALAIEPRSVAVLNAVGTAYDELHHPALASRYYAQALAIEPRSADTLNNMAVSALLAGKQAEARELFETAFAIDSRDARIRTNIALLDLMAAPRVARLQPNEGKAPGLVIERTGPAAFRLNLPPPRPGDLATPLALSLLPYGRSS